MKVMEIEGGRDLTGTIRVSGAKNATVALIPAAILSDEEVTLYNVPNISDTNALIDIIKLLNGSVTYENETMKIDEEFMDLSDEIDNSDKAGSVRTAFSSNTGTLRFKVVC